MTESYARYTYDIAFWLTVLLQTTCRAHMYWHKYQERKTRRAQQLEKAAGSNQLPKMKLENLADAGLISIIAFVIFITSLFNIWFEKQTADSLIR